MTLSTYSWTSNYVYKIWCTKTTIQSERRVYYCNFIIHKEVHCETLPAGHMVEYQGFKRSNIPGLAVLRFTQVTHFFFVTYCNSIRLTFKEAHRGLSVSLWFCRRGITVKKKSDAWCDTGEPKLQLSRKTPSAWEWDQNECFCSTNIWHIQ